jgi:hypothetical protein
MGRELGMVAKILGAVDVFAYISWSKSNFCRDWEFPFLQPDAPFQFANKPRVVLVHKTARRYVHERQKQPVRINVPAPWQVRAKKCLTLIKMLVSTAERSAATSSSKKLCPSVKKPCALLRQAIRKNKSETIRFMVLGPFRHNRYVMYFLFLLAGKEVEISNLFYPAVHNGR